MPNTTYTINNIININKIKNIFNFTMLFSILTSDKILLKLFLVMKQYFYYYYLEYHYRN